MKVAYPEGLCTRRIHLKFASRCGISETWHVIARSFDDPLYILSDRVAEPLLLPPPLLLLMMKGEKLEDDIIEIATVLREKADEMVAETGAINFEIIQPMIDEIAVLKSKYK